MAGAFVCNETNMSSKNKKNFPWTVLVIGAVLLIGLYMIVNSGENNNSNIVASSGVLTVSEESWNMGAISMKNGLSYKEIELRNNTDFPVTVTEMETSCMCTTATITNADGTKGPTKGMVGHGSTTRMSQTIAPGETAKLSVVFDPNAHGPNAVGPITRNVTLKTNSPDQPVIDLKFSGLVTK